ncbi:triphosphoribosyl-dephospho-CoA synthase, partial [Salmonella enterica subsp. enterica serovar Mbandaka]|nr:triphosphoribosyl-dephospho-CoA synthase [Salmonella enterica subsp. enterica serovar Mbandaka]
MMPIPANPTNASIQPQSLYDAWADLAWRAMLTEVNLSPKPGLVDRLNCGA